MATKKELLAQEIAKAIGAGKPVGRKLSTSTTRTAPKPAWR